MLTSSHALVALLARREELMRMSGPEPPRPTVSSPLSSQQHVSRSAVKAAADIRDNHSRTPRNSKSTRLLWNLPRVRVQSHATKRCLAVERPQVTRVERTGPVLLCAACGCVAANHSSDVSRCGPLTKWRTARSSFIQNWRDELACTKSQISSRMYTSLHSSI